MELSDYEDLMTADGLDNAIIGIGHRCGQPPLVVYDVSAVIEILMARDGMSYEEAYEYFDFNIEGAWVGDQTPVWMHLLEKD